MWTVRSVTCVSMLAATYPLGPLFPLFLLFPRTPAASALPDPAERRLGPAGRRIRRRLMLALAPGAARAVLVMAVPARDADHALYSAARFAAIAPLAG
jgi:hypothetical protein